MFGRSGRASTSWPRVSPVRHRSPPVRRVRSAAMKYRALGKTRLQISEISFGTGDNAGLMVLGSPQEQRKAVARALELGKILAELRADVLVSTKVEIMPETIDDIEGAITRSLEGSLRRLRRDYVDFLLIHNPPRLARNLEAPYWTPLTPDDLLGPQRSRTGA